MGLFDRLKAGLSKTRDVVAKGLGVILGAEKLEGPAAEKLESALLAADLGPELCARLMQRLRAGEPEQVRRSLRGALLEVINEVQPSNRGLLSRRSLGTPEVTLMVGVNGSGKTTTCGKLAAHWVSRGEKVMVAGADTFRAAAMEQLQLWSKRAGSDFFPDGKAQIQGADPAAVSFDAVAKALAGKYDRLIIDTAGRLQNKSNLMEELRKIHRVCSRALPGAPHQVLLVLDGTAGRNMVSQARLFNDAVPLTGMVITKLDGTAKAGAVISVLSEMKVPVELVGVGESADVLQEFVPSDFVSALVADE